MGVKLGYSYFLTNPTDLPKPANSKSFQLLCFFPILIKFGLGTNIGLFFVWLDRQIKIDKEQVSLTSTLLLLYSCLAPSKLLTKLLPKSCSAPARFLLCSVLLCSTLTLLLPCSCPASALLLRCSLPANGLLLVVPTSVWQPPSTSAPYDFSRHGENRILWYMIICTVLFNEWTFLRKYAYFLGILCPRYRTRLGLCELHLWEPMNCHEYACMGLDARENVLIDAWICFVSYYFLVWS